MNNASKLAQDLATPVARSMLASIFLISGAGKLGAYAATAGYMEAMGVPGVLLPLVIALELGAGLLVVVGWQTRSAALALAGFSVASAILFHRDLADPIQSIMLMKNIALAGGFVLLAAVGGGAWSVDRLRKGAREAHTATDYAGAQRA